METEYVGKKIWILTDEGKYNGIIHSVDEKNKRLILQKVSMADGRKIRGLQIFFTNEIRDLQLLDQNGSDADTDDRSSDRGLDEPTNEKTLENDEAEPKSTFTEKDPSDEGSRLIARKPFLPNKYLSGEENLNMTVEDDEFCDLPDVILVDELNEKFDQAVYFINEQRVVGLSAEANQMGRSGVLCLLIVGCRGATYVFDVHKLGAECFSKGLRSFLENTYLLKVVHDCRLLSDCLFHVYDIEMRNIFDTQVADIIIYKQKRGKLPREVNGLEPCLFDYLNLKPSKCSFSSIIGKFTKKDANLWTTRPLQRELLNAVSEKVLFLRELRIAQMEKMLAEFLYGVDIYLAVFRDSPVDGTNALSKTRKVPGAFHDLKKITERRWRRYEDKDKQMSKRDEFYSGGQNGGDIVSKNDGGWTEGIEFADMYRQKHGKIVERDDLGQSTWSSFMADEAQIDPAMRPWGSSKPDDVKDSSVKGQEPLVFRSEGDFREKKKKRSKNSINSSTVVEGIPEKESGSAKDTMVGDTVERATKDVQLTTEIIQTGAVRIESFGKDMFNNNLRVGPRSSNKSTPADNWIPYKGKENDSNYSPNAKQSSLVTRYHEEYPPLSPENQNGSKSVDLQKDTPVSEMRARKNLASVLGVKTDSARPVPVGRAKNRSYFASCTPPLRASPGPGDASRAKNRIDILTDTHSFPTDEDILHTDPIIRVDHDSPVVGQNMRVQKIKLKE